MWTCEIKYKVQIDRANEEFIISCTKRTILLHKLFHPIVNYYCSKSTSLRGWLGYENN